jgi:ketosteroid isomerase-like protein
MMRQDLDTLDALLADDLTYTHSRGATDTKASFLELIRNPGDHGRYLSVELSNTQVTPLGDAAIVRGRAQITLERPADQPALSYPVLFLDVWERRQGRWRLVAWQATRVTA